jgi:hypothetical protein
MYMKGEVLASERRAFCISSWMRRNLETFRLLRLVLVVWQQAAGPGYRSRRAIALPPSRHAEQAAEVFITSFTALLPSRDRFLHLSVGICTRLVLIYIRAITSLTCSNDHCSLRLFGAVAWGWSSHLF